jgi:anaerobic ribonucleoside-triphosphate reductase activating protein
VDTLLNVGMIIPHTEAEGPGKRFALWVQGCPMRCPGCCNPEYLEFTDNKPTPVPDILAQIQRSHDQHTLEGVTFLGGEPFSHAPALAQIAQGVHAMGLTVMIFSGFTLKAIGRMAQKQPGVRALLEATDLLVDGPFMEQRLDKTRRWIGSTNQQPHDLTGAYTNLVTDWDTSPNTLEIRVINGKLIVNGSPFLLDKLGRKTTL